jgi:hypothetical protein
MASGTGPAPQALGPAAHGTHRGTAAEPVRARPSIRCTCRSHAPRGLRLPVQRGGRVVGRLQDSPLGTLRASSRIAPSDTTSSLVLAVMPSFYWLVGGWESGRRHGGARVHHGGLARRVGLDRVLRPPRRAQQRRGGRASRTAVETARLLVGVGVRSERGPVTACWRARAGTPSRVGSVGPGIRGEPGLAPDAGASGDVDGSRGVTTPVADSWTRTARHLYRAACSAKWAAISSTCAAGASLPRRCLAVHRRRSAAKAALASARSSAIGRW